MEHGRIIIWNWRARSEFIVAIFTSCTDTTQAARGATSHFNAGTPLDIALFGIMGTAIGVLWLASAGVLAALFRQKFENRAWGWALRMGMLITVLGSASGGMMLRMTAQQAEARQAGHPVTTVGGHRITPRGEGVVVTLSIRQTGLLAWLVRLLTSRLTKRYVLTEANGLKRRSEAEVP